MRSILLGSAAFTLLFATLAHPAAKIPTAFHPGHIFRDCPDCPEMVVIPAASFLNGRACQ
jgi:hypothetical protein